MRLTHRTAPLAVVVPFHNEERHLPRLIDSLRSQRDADLPVVFVNNASTDRSPDLVRQCDEVRTGRWDYLDERRIGKFYALKAGISHCIERYRAEYVGGFDADTHHGSPDWLRTALTIVERATSDFGYTYSPFIYSGFDHLPRFRGTYLAYQRCLNRLIARIGWGLNGLGFIAAAAAAAEYLARARAGSSLDVPLSLFLLSQGRQAIHHPGLLISSGRRIVANGENFRSWCFFRGRYYSHKDINSPHKLDLNQPGVVDDLREEQTDEFFQRRATKLVCRDFIPLGVFDAQGVVFERIAAGFGTNVVGGIRAAFAHLGTHTEFFMAGRFDDLTKQIEAHPASAPLIDAVADLMRGDYAATSAQATASEETEHGN